MRRLRRGFAHGCTDWETQPIRELTLLFCGTECTIRACLIRASLSANPCIRVANPRLPNPCWRPPHRDTRTRPALSTARDPSSFNFHQQFAARHLHGHRAGAITPAGWPRRRRRNSMCPTPACGPRRAPRFRCAECGDPPPARTGRWCGSGNRVCLDLRAKPPRQGFGRRVAPRVGLLAQEDHAVRIADVHGHAEMSVPGCDVQFDIPFIKRKPPHLQRDARAVRIQHARADKTGRGADGEVAVRSAAADPTDSGRRCARRCRSPRTRRRRG